MTRPPFRVELALAYCAYAQIAPNTIARFEDPAELAPWFVCYLAAVRSKPVQLLDDLRGQPIRRAILRDAQLLERFPRDVRIKALEVEAQVRDLTVVRLVEIGAALEVCHLLECKPKRQRDTAWQHQLEAMGEDAA